MAHQEISHENYRGLLISRERVASLTQQLKESEELLKFAQATEERLRESRITYCIRSTKLKEEVVELQVEAEDLRAQIRTLQESTGHPSDPDDSDLEGEPNPRRRFTD